MSRHNFVAVGLLTRRDLDVLGSGFRRAIPLEKTTEFEMLLELIDRNTAGADQPVPNDL